MKNKGSFSLIFGKDRTSTINLVLIAKLIWCQRHNIIKWECIGIVIGLIICFSIPKEYVSTVKMVPENKSIQIMNFSDLSSLLTLKNSSNDAYSYRLYPLILDSNPFLYELLSVQVNLSDKDGSETQTMRDLLGKEYKYPWWRIMSWLDQTSEEQPGTKYMPSESDLKLIERLRNNISLAVMDRTGSLELAVKMQNAVAAAVLADTIASRIEREVSVYRDNKDLQRYDYVKNLFNESKAEYESCDLRYAQYLDSNHGLSKNTDKIEMNRFKVERDLKRENYNLNSIMFLSEEFKQSIYSPVYYIFEPPTVAVKSSYPRKLVILSYCMFFFGYIPLLKSVFKRA